MSITAKDFPLLTPTQIAGAPPWPSSKAWGWMERATKAQRLADLEAFARLLRAMRLELRDEADNAADPILLNYSTALEQMAKAELAYDLADELESVVKELRG